MKLSKLLLVGVILGLSTYAAFAQVNKYKCLVQMSNYVGEGAYITVSLINPQGVYEKTLQVLGDDEKWYETLEKWNEFYLQQPSQIDGVTGASVSGGGRSIVTLDLDASKIDKGYKLRFESAVENNKYYFDDVEIPLSSQTLTHQNNGKGYIRFVRFIKVK